MNSFSRLDATQALVAALTDDPATPVIASLGHPAYDLFSAGDRPANFYTWGSMGLASSIGLGLAMARPDLRVCVLDGDGSLLMNLGSLATIGWCQPEGLVLVVWDNEEYGTTGGQETATRHGADLEGAAKAMGIAQSLTVRTADEFSSAIARARRDPGPWAIIAKVSESAPTVKPPLDCVFIKQRFMDAIGSPEAATRGAGLCAAPRDFARGRPLDCARGRPLDCARGRRHGGSRSLLSPPRLQSSRAREPPLPSSTQSA